MKVLALVFMLVVAVYARPPKGGSGDEDDAGTQLFVDLVKLCVRLAEEAGSDDKRSWETVFQLYGGVCEGIKAEMEKELGDVEMPDKRVKSGDFDRFGGKKSGPTPTGLPDSGDFDAQRKGLKYDKKSGPTPTGLPDSGDFDARRKGPSGDFDDKKSGPAPTGQPDSGRRGGKGGDKSGMRKPRPSGSPDMDRRGRGDQAPSPVQSLLDICFRLAKMGEEMEKNGADKRSLEEVLAGMEEVCLAAFVQAKEDGFGSD